MFRSPDRPRSTRPCRWPTRRIWNGDAPSPLNAAGCCCGSPIIPFDNDDQAIEIANNTPYGLSGCVFTNNLRRAHRAAEELETGEVLINGAANLGVTRPFGGIGISGMGKEGGRQGLEEFLHIKTVSMA